MSHQLRLLNLGCGKAFHPDWVNIDIHGQSKAILGYDLRLGIPFAANTFDVVYHSHVLEHFTEQCAIFFIQECFRVLRPGGVLRLAVPDLENIVKAYLKSLDDVRAGIPEAKHRHRWMIIELVDQMTRQHSGGTMGKYWRQSPLPEEAFIRQRVGQELEQALQQKPTPIPAHADQPLLENFDPAFGQSGELHRWMYDEESLRELLTQTGFEPSILQSHTTSLQPAIEQYRLDTAPDGFPRKPDSLYMEARKPTGFPVSRVRIATFSTADSGGAGIAAERLHSALNQMDGLSSHLYLGHQSRRSRSTHVVPATNEQVGPSPHAPQEAVNFGYLAYEARRASILQRYPCPTRDEYYSVPGGCCDPASLPYFDDFHIVHLHWTSGLLDPSTSFEALRGRHIVWTLHDMNAFTGGCHYSGECQKFTEHCGACPLLASTDEKDLSFQTWRNRMATYRSLDFTIVTPSRWLADEARKSSLLKRFHVEAIPNAVPIERFRPLDRRSLRQNMGITAEQTVLLFSSQSLTNTRKGTRYLLEALRRLADSEEGRNFVILLLGDNPPPEFFRTKLTVHTLGSIRDEEQMSVIYNISDAVIVPSLEDNLPNVIAEAAACGTPVVAFAVGGIVEMIHHEETGWLAEAKNIDSLYEGILWTNTVRNTSEVRRKCRIMALEQWNPVRVAQTYRSLYERLITK